MNGSELRAWREKAGLTQLQLAQRLKMTRTTVQNWEGSVTALPQAVEMSCEIWGARLRQENPDLGPVTLIYSDGPMFVDPYGPRRRLAMMHQEPYRSNTAALARVQQLWGRDDFHNPFVIEASGVPLWNVVQLQSVISGEDGQAPVLANLLTAIANEVRANSAHFVRGARVPTPDEIKACQNEIEAQADELARIARSGLDNIIRDQLLIEAVFAPDALVHSVAEAFVVHEKDRSRVETAPRLEPGGYVLDYRGCEITWPRTRIDSSRWTVNLCSNDPRLFAKLGGNVVIDDFASLENAIAKARRRVDELL